MDSLIAEYSTEELAALSELLGIRKFPGVDVERISMLADEVRQTLIDVATRSLFARHVLEPVEGTKEIEVRHPHSDIFTTCTAPEVVLVAQRESGDELDRRSFFVAPEFAVEQVQIAADLYRFILIDVSLVMAAVAEFVGLNLSPAPEARSFRTSISAIEMARSYALEGNHSKVHELLADAPDDFANALESDTAVCQISWLERQESGFDGGEIVWFDTGASGFWRIVGRFDADDAPDANEVVVTATGGDALLGLVLAVDGRSAPG